MNKNTSDHKGVQKVQFCRIFLDNDNGDKTMIEFVDFAHKIMYGNAKKVNETFGLSKDELDEFVLNGWVRTHKRRETKQARRTFNFPDIYEALNYQANGRKPRSKKRSFK